MDAICLDERLQSIQQQGLPIRAIHGNGIPLERAVPYGSLIDMQSGTAVIEMWVINPFETPFGNELRLGKSRWMFYDFDSGTKSALEKLATKLGKDPKSLYFKDRETGELRLDYGAVQIHAIFDPNVDMTTYFPQLTPKFREN